jgi:hypothetical protein
MAKSATLLRNYREFTEKSGDQNDRQGEILFLQALGFHSEKSSFASKETICPWEIPLECKLVFLSHRSK